VNTEETTVPAPPRSDRVEPLIAVRDLRTHYPARGRDRRGRPALCQAVDGVSFDIARGTSLGLVGESGCGKTTLGRTLLRLVEATAGQVTFDGTDVLSAVGARLRKLRRDMQIVFQDPYGSLNPRMNIVRIVEEPLVIHRIMPRPQRRALVLDLLERVGVPPSRADRYPHELSGGQRQRVSIARAIALRPQFLVCDEPVSALDVSIQAQILNLLGDLRREFALTYLFIAHDLAVVERFCERVAVMYLGRIVEIADAADLFTRPRHPYTMALLAAAPQPDPARRRHRVVLGGEPPSPFDPPPGCPFHPRCPFATMECHSVPPLLESRPGLAAGHAVACHRAAEALAWDHAGTATATAARRREEIPPSPLEEPA